MICTLCSSAVDLSVRSFLRVLGMFRDRDDREELTDMLIEMVRDHGAAKEDASVISVREPAFLQR